MSTETNGQTARHLPCADVYLTQSAVTVELEAPGFGPDELAVSVSGPVVTVSGHRFGHAGDRHYLQDERGPTEFRRVFHLPEGTDTAHLNVRIVDGVVVLHAPRSEHPGTPTLEITPVVSRVRPDTAVS